jgi:hypothetical protein
VRSRRNITKLIHHVLRCSTLIDDPLPNSAKLLLTQRQQGKKKLGLRTIAAGISRAVNVYEDHGPINLCFLDTLLFFSVRPANSAEIGKKDGVVERWEE